jgi:hypothetical protein
MHPQRERKILMWLSESLNLNIDIGGSYGALRRFQYDVGAKVASGGLDRVAERGRGATWHCPAGMLHQ